MLKNPQILVPTRMGEKRKNRRAGRQVQKPNQQGISSDVEDFSSGEISKARAALLQWYDANQRTLPWRTAARCGSDGNRAYAVWVSEIMLQQTQVSTVIDYYNRWMNKWPTVQDLAAATIDEVNDLWAGLGYYRRARFLLEGAKAIVEAGEFPKSAADLRKVKGIGEYTAGAIASIAFTEAVPVVDGNVIRVISRLKAISSNPKESATTKSIWRLAGQLVDPHRPGDFNQALMELGATLCSRSSPNCSSCPVSDQCLALSLSKKFESAEVTDYPKKAIKPKQRQDFAAVCVLEIVKDSDRRAIESKNYKNLKANNYEKSLVLLKRPSEGLLAGLWEFPMVLVSEGDDQDARREAVDQYLSKSLGLSSAVDFVPIFRADVGECVHIFSHIRLHMHVELLVISIKGGPDTLEEKGCLDLNTCKIVDDDSIRSMGLTSGVRKVYTMVKSFKQKTLPFLAVDGKVMRTNGGL
ncbi:hhH-GPD base excision DNA repair family protein [Wolffia australiana]